MSEPVVRFSGVGKMYKVFPTRTDNLLDALGVARVFGRQDRYREFWALRGVDFELGAGERLGIIGRNGAGKSTLLKLVTGNFPQTEGEITVRGDVQAVLEIGGGLHPEFTGRENIHAALGYMGLSARQINEAEEEIADFTELGRFLEQPFKTYSQGMQARLSFAIATTVRPEILIVDEILGAGDAYFFTRSTARMRELIEGGASVLLVSHGLDQIVRFCDEAIWLDRGRVVMRGPSIEIVKAYEKFIRELEDKRLLAKNRKAGDRFDAFERESYADQLVVEMVPPPGGTLDVSSVVLRRDGTVDDTLAVGDAQDADTSETAAVILDGGLWSAPLKGEGVYYRRVESRGATADRAAQVVFNLWFLYLESRYAVELTYRSSGGAAQATVRHIGSGEPVTVELPAAVEWAKVDLAVHDGRREDPPAAAAAPRPVEVSRWPGEGTLHVTNVSLRDADGREQAIFEAGSPMQMVIDVTARQSGRFPLTPTATLYRSDGVLVSNHVGDEWDIELGKDDHVTIELDFGPLNLGDGSYVFSIGLYRRLSHAEPEIYDLLDRSYELEVTGNAPFDNGVFSHPSRWTMTPGSRSGTTIGRGASPRPVLAPHEEAGSAST